MYLRHWKRCDSLPNGSILDAGRRGMETEETGGVDADPVPFQAAGPWTQHRLRVSKPGLRPHAHCTAAGLWAIYLPHPGGSVQAAL